MKAIKNTISYTSMVRCFRLYRFFWAFPALGGSGSRQSLPEVSGELQQMAPSLTRHRFYFRILLLSIVITSCQKERQDLSFDASEPFIRFSLKVNDDGKITSLIRDNNLDDETDSYTHTTTDIIKIPVIFSGVPLQEDLTINFTTEISGTFEGILLSEENTMVLEAGTHTDTLTVAFTDRWSADDNAQLQFRITSVSDPAVTIGYPRDFLPLDELQINLGAIQPNTMSFSDNRIEILGQVGEEIDFTIAFSQGIIAAELTDRELFSAVEGFNYTITQHPFNDGDKHISYTLTVEEDLQIDDVYFQTTLFLASDIMQYIPSGNTVFQIVKPQQVPRDIAVFTAQHFYDLSDPFYRTYGEQWNDFNEDGVCTWRSFNAFTFPVIVPADDPNAVLYDDRGTQDPTDDIYHHAFRIGFNTPVAGNTTNSFNLKRWFTNESSSAANSPGFNIQEAIEFFPEEGDNPTRGTLQIIPQIITISASGDGGNSYLIAIGGEGTYEELPSGIFELTFELRATNMELFGGTQTGYYRIFNSNMYTDPDPIPEDCMVPITL